MSEHALHFDPDCEECVYLARPTAVRIGLDVDRLASALISGGLWPIYDPSMPNGYRGGPFDMDYRQYAAAIAAAYEADHEGR